MMLNDAAEIERTDSPRPDEDFEVGLRERVDKYLRYADMYEDERRKSDRIGGNLFAGRHWDTRVPPDRAALTVNYSRALILQLISLQTKQDPIWVVSPRDAGDREAARVMQTILPLVWEHDGMPRKLRNAMLLGETTRTCAAKTIWDDSLQGWEGDVTTDIIPVWRLILDPRTSDPEKMRFIGDRALMSRADAMLLYPEAAGLIRESGDEVSGSALSSSGAESPHFWGAWALKWWPAAGRSSMTSSTRADSGRAASKDGSAAAGKASKTTTALNIPRV